MVLNEGGEGVRGVVKGKGEVLVRLERSSSQSSVGFGWWSLCVGGQDPMRLVGMEEGEGEELVVRFIVVAGGPTTVVEVTFPTVKERDLWLMGVKPLLFPTTQQT